MFLEKNLTEEELRGEKGHARSRGDFKDTLEMEWEERKDSGERLDGKPSAVASLDTLIMWSNIRFSGRSLLSMCSHSFSASVFLCSITCIFRDLGD